MQVWLLLVITGVWSVGATPQFQPAAVYAYEFSSPDQLKHEERDVFGGVHGGYRVRYPNGGGQFMHSYSYPARPTTFTTTQDSSFGPAGTVISFTGSTRGPQLLQLLVRPPLVRQAEAVLVSTVPAAGSFANSKLSPALVSFQQQADRTGSNLEQQLQIREPGDAVVVEALPQNEADVYPQGSPQEARASPLSARRRFNR